MATRDRKVIIGWIGGFAIILVLLLFVLARYTSYQFTEMHRDLREIAETEAKLTEIATRIAQNQYKQQLAIEKIFRIGSTVRQGAEGELLKLRAAFEKYGKAVDEAIAQGINVTENAQSASAETSDKYMYIYNLLDGLGNEHKVFEDEAGAIIELIRALKFEEVQVQFASIEEAGRTITDHANMILVRLEDYVRQTVRRTDEHASSSAQITLIITAVEAGLAIIFALIILIHMLRYVTALKKTEEILRRHEHELEAIVLERTADLKKSNETLARMKEDYEELYYDAPVGYQEIDREGVIVRVNNTEAQMLGYEIDEMVGKPIFDFVVAEERDESRKAVQAKVTGLQDIRPFDRHFQRKDGMPIPVHVEEKLIRDRKGRITGIRSTVRDISLRKKAESEIHRMKNAYEELFNEAPVGYHEIDTTGRIVRVNKTEGEMFGYAPDEMTGKFIFDFIAPDEREEANSAVRAKFAGEMEIKPFRRTYVRKDGSILKVMITEKLIKNEKGVVSGMRSTVQAV